MEPSDLALKYLKDARIMQLATSDGEQPWVCTVYFVANEKFEIYWLSLPSRRHSQEIEQNNKVAVTVPIKFDQPIIGVQTEGAVIMVEDAAEVQKVMEQYVLKYNTGHDFYENFISSKNKHQMYKFIPSRLYIFDEVNFPGGERQEVNLKNG
jgi:uncharacterized protein